MMYDELDKVASLDKCFLPFWIFSKAWRRNRPRILRVRMKPNLSDVPCVLQMHSYFE